MQTAYIDTVSSLHDLENSSFSSELRSQIDFRASSNEETEIRTSRFYYTVGSFKLLLEQEIKVENISGLTINSVPHAPDWCTGIVNIRGIIMPIVNMHIFLKTGIDNSDKKKTLIMMEHKNYTPIIFEIDKLPKMIFTEDFADEKMPKKSPNWLIKALNNGKNTLFEVDHSLLLDQLKHTKT